MRRAPPTEQTWTWLTPIDAGDDELTLVLRGPIGAPEARIVERHVLEGVLRGRRRVVIDLRGVTEVGPGLLGAILRVRRGLTGVNGTFALVVDGGPVEDLVRVSVLRALVVVAATPREAVRQLDADRVRLRA